jgi:RHS repeat-associated protein
MRTRSWGADGSRVYLPGYEHRTDTGETKVYVGDYAVISRTGATRKVEYLLKDRLGSVDAVANSSGTVTETRGYDAFGKPRDGSWNDLTPAKIASTAVTPKGFTQHEHLNQLELIHMNGRAYDYHLGRFTGVDPFIQFPLNSQSLNPYSYILNNPLAGTDPTGYELECTDKGACTFQGSDIDRLEVHKDGKGKVTSVVAEVDGQRIQVQSAQLKNGASTQTLNFSRQDTLDRAESTIGAAVQRSNQADGQAEYRGQDLRPHVDMRREAARVFGSASLPAAVGVCIAAMPECIALIQLGSKLKRTPEAKGGVQPATTEEMAVAMERASAERAANMRQSGSGRTADDMLSDARSARDALAKRLGELPADKRPATVTGGYNIQTGEVAARACGGGKCAEDHVVATLGGDKSVIRFTEAVRPRAINPPYKQVPVCTRCEPKYGRDSFPSGTQFKSDQQ